MKKHLGTAVVCFLGTAAMVNLFDLLAARFDIEEFVQIIGRPGHIAFVGALGLILAIGSFSGPAAEKSEASQETNETNPPKLLRQCI